eukprot:290600_1
MQSIAETDHEINDINEIKLNDNNNKDQPCMYDDNDTQKQQQISWIVWTYGDNDTHSNSSNSSYSNSSYSKSIQYDGNIFIMNIFNCSGEEAESNDESDIKGIGDAWYTREIRLQFKEDSSKYEPNYSSGRYGCSNSVIYCPSNANCIIQCSNQYSCKDITINASPNTTLNITCNGPRESCRNSIINGNINTEMNIKCSNSYACYNSTIYGKYASKLHMIDCATDFWTCYMLNIYCPPNINGQKRCIFEGDDSFGVERQEPINLYAINSWNDIEFKRSETASIISSIKATDIMVIYLCVPSIVQIPTTFNPTTNTPTTNSPTTNSPTTNAPTTFNPTTNSPTTNSPTTNAPTTFNPTTNSPTTNSPTTNA